MTSDYQPSPESDYTEDTSVSLDGNEWFHGDMNRCSSSETLSGAPMGSFLVWRARSKQYYLSFVPEVSTIEHFPIHAIANQFFFRGESYPSLYKLVESFCCSSPGAQPLHVRNAPSCSNTDKSNLSESFYFIAMQDFAAAPSSQQISLERGDIVRGLGEVDTQWTYVRHESSRSSGLVPFDLLRPLKCDDQDTGLEPEQLPYFHSGNAQHFVTLLSRAGFGGFLVRSASAASSYALLVNTGSVIQKFLVELENNKLRLGSRLFEHFDDIIERYCQRPITASVCLLHAVLNTEACTIAPDVLCITSANSYPNEDQNHNGTTKVIAAVQALRKSKEEKPWKPCWVNLNDHANGKCELVVSDTDHSARVRSAFDLECCQLLPLHWSVFNRDGCVYLAHNEPDDKGTFFCFRPAHTFVLWMSLLRRFISIERRIRRRSRQRVQWLSAGSVPAPLGRPFQPPKHSQIAIIHVHIDRFRSESLLKTDCLYQAAVLLNGVRVFTSQLVPTTSVRNQATSIVFDANFISLYGPTSLATVQLSLCLGSPSKKGVASKTVVAISSLCRLEEAILIEETLDEGFSFRCTRQCIPVLSTEEYAPILSAIKDDNFSLCEWAASKLSGEFRKLFAYSLWVLFLSSPSQLQAMVSAIVTRALSEGTSTSPLRSDCLCTTLLTSGLRLAARAQLESELQPILYTISGRKAVQPGDLESVVDVLCRVAEEPAARRLLSLVAHVGQKVFSDDILATYKIITNVFVLRFANPILLAMNTGGSPLVLQIAKLVLSSANAACSNNPQPTNECTASTSTFRILFEGIARATDIELVGVECSLSCDYMAVMCSLLSRALHGEDGCPIQLTPQVNQIIEKHSLNVS